MCTHDQCSEQKQEKYQYFHLKITIFTAVKNRSISHRRVITGLNVGCFQRHLFSIFEIISFCFVIAIHDLVHDVETIFHLSYVLTASGNLF